MNSPRLVFCRAGGACSTELRVLGFPRFNLVSLFLLLICYGLSGTTHAQVQTAPETDAVGDEIRRLVMDLADREKAGAAIGKLTAIKDDRVPIVLGHVESRSLAVYQDQLVFVAGAETDADGKKVSLIYDLFTLLPTENAPLADPLAKAPSSELKPFSEVRKARQEIIRVRRIVALGSKNPEIRLSTVRRLGETVDASSLEPIRKLANEDVNKRVRRAAKESAALIVLGTTDAKARPDDVLEAVKTLGELQSLRALGVLQAKRASGDLPQPLRDAIATAVLRIERHKTTAEWLSHLFRGFSLGTILVLIALGLAVTFGTMGVINMAHGEMLMIGAVATWACFEYISPNLPPRLFDWYYVIGFPAAFLAAAFAGWLTEILIVRHLYKRPLDSLLATIGISFMLIQAVRLWKGDNLGMRHPSWATGGWEVLQDVVLPYNRLFLIALTLFCLLAVVGIFRYTRIGLLIRATVQNREMAQALGVNTRLVDMFTFAFGAGLAGLAGYGIFLTSNPTPEMGQTFIVPSFLTVVVGGVGKLFGVIISGLGIGFLTKIIEPLKIGAFQFDPGWATVLTLALVVGFIRYRPAGIFPDKGRMADQAARAEMPWLSDNRARLRRDLMLGGILVFLGLVLVPFLYAFGYISPGTLNKLGQYLAFAVMAIGLDLVWGYAGALSLCQCLFFALGGYCMGFYLINHGPIDKFGVPECLAYVMSDVTDKRAPGYLAYFHTFPGMLILGLIIPALVAFVIGLVTFRSRVKGVYFSILTQAILVAFWNVFVKNDMKLGGTNGLTKFDTILGLKIADKTYPALGDGYATVALQQTRFWLYIVSFLVLGICFLIARWLVSSSFGRVLVAVRDDETRLRFVGYKTWAYKAAVFVVGAMFAAIGGMLFVPQKGIITPAYLEPFWSIMVVVWVALGGRSSLWGAVIGTIGVSMLYDWMTSFAPDYWKLVLGGLFILVPLVLPGGLMSLPEVFGKLMKTRKSRGYDLLPAGKIAEGGAQ